MLRDYPRAGPSNVISSMGGFYRDELPTNRAVVRIRLSGSSITLVRTKPSRDLPSLGSATWWWPGQPPPTWSVYTWRAKYKDLAVPDLAARGKDSAAYSSANLLR